jgi:hypothetical protein
MEPGVRSLDIDLAWWPTFLRSWSAVDDDTDDLSEGLKTKLLELGALVGDDDVDAFEELTLP